MLQPGKMITITRRLDALHRDHPSLEDVIKEAEGRFRDQELEHDWSGQPIEEDGAADEKRSIGEHTSARRQSSSRSPRSHSSSVASR